MADMMGMMIGLWQPQHEDRLAGAVTRPHNWAARPEAYGADPTTSVHIPAGPEASSDIRTKCETDG